MTFKPYKANSTIHHAKMLSFHFVLFNSYALGLFQITSAMTKLFFFLRSIWTGSSHWASSHNFLAPFLVSPPPYPEPLPNKTSCPVSGRWCHCHQFSHCSVIIPAPVCDWNCPSDLVSATSGTDGKETCREHMDLVSICLRILCFLWTA